jgi:hypothetical protein
MEEKQMKMDEYRARLHDSFSKDPLTGRTYTRGERSALIATLVLCALAAEFNFAVGILVLAIWAVGWMVYMGATKPQPNQSQRGDDKES